MHMTNMAEIVQIGTQSHRPSVPHDLQRDFNTKCSTLRINCIASVLASLYGSIFGEILNNLKFKIHKFFLINLHLFYTRCT